MKNVVDHFSFLLAKQGLHYARNKRALAKLHQSHKGQRCFLIGAGPSLKVEDLSRLQNEVTFAANKIYLAFDQTPWRPTYYSAEDQQVVKSITEEIEAFKYGTKLFPESVLEWVDKPFSDSLYFPYTYEDYLPGHPRFSANAYKGLYWGSTVVYSFLQLAVYMGFSPIYLIGMDFSFAVPKQKEVVGGGELLTSEGEKNHFHPDYRKEGEKWYAPNLEAQRMAFEAGAQFCKSNGIEVYNATRGGKLEAFPRADLDEVLGSA